ncbi:type IV pilus biogenesis protein PilP [Cupriavidus taiwanensis]|uniref:type IV pilus biogenesis protein PilP n=1 Tax=Cupriavidus taiwanensis TaxID=164546 RepID=UPI0039C34F8C
MQNRAFNLRCSQFGIAIAAALLQSVADSANAASSMSDPISAAIAEAGRKQAPQPASQTAVRPQVSQEAAPPASTPAAQPPSVSAAGPAAAAGASSLNAAVAAEAATPPRHTEASELAALQSQIALWKARAEIAKFKAEVKRSEESLLSATAAPSGAVPGISLAGPVPAAGVAERMSRQAAEAPRLVSLRAFDGQFNAVVEVNGRIVPVVAGDAIDGGWKVVGIDDGGVKLANGKRVRTLRP